MSKGFKQLRMEYGDLSTGQRVVFTSVALADATAKIAGYIDLARRPAATIRGPKWAWALAMVVNGIGPLAYWTIARK